MGRVRECVGDQEQFWRMAIETWQASGLSVRQFCSNECLSEPSFYIWRKKLAGGDTEQDSHDKTSAFIEVSMPMRDLFAIELLLISGNTMRVYSGADNAILSNVMSALRASGLC
ncbi:MAG: hypothetical protein A2Y12_10490 [Planctomycetes bacterium GWF2_42_9]|nr:MAG: hypothetical protein A2Y12_10490 [Planctomycetes bacterium GWF2_42_9]